jgi:hypothetical protein
MLNSKSNIRFLDASENNLASVNLTGVYQHLLLKNIESLHITKFISIGKINHVEINYSGIEDISVFQSVNILNVVGCRFIRVSGLSDKRIYFCGCSKAHFKLPESFTFKDLDNWKIFPDLPHCSTLEFKRFMCDYCRESQRALFRYII